ncbi:MAG TPA: chlorophyllide reductase subunit Z, partial [Rhodospirillaceae bacterium]|nr:chlorophyllide reductase subunit Z [Rhodospirillaceae bacterium]
FHIIPLGSQLDMAESTPTRLRRDMPWDEEARLALDKAVEMYPVISRISAAKSLRDRAEATAQQADRNTVSIDDLVRARTQLMSGRAA